MNSKDKPSMKRSAILPCLVVNLLIIPVACQGQQSGEKAPVRQPVVAGSFYLSNPDHLKTQLSEFFQAAPQRPLSQKVAAIISPHAGYIFSGEVAAAAYAQLNPEQTFDHIFLLGSSHHVFLNGASIYNKGNYSTPLGIVEVDTKLANELITEHPFFEFVPQAHAQEHSLEVQLPFLQYRLKKPFKIVPIIIGTQSTATCKKIAEALKPYFNEKNLFVISSDFSHYPDYEDAMEVDQTTGNAISTNSPENFLKSLRDNASKEIPGLATSACGWTSILTLLEMSSETPGIKIRHTKYQNSGDSQFGDRIRVVGYHSFVFTRPESAGSFIGLSLTAEDKITLLKMARQAIEAVLQNKPLPEVNEAEISESLKMSCGAFVTLTEEHKLRGCIGRFLSDKPLYRIVQEMAVASALHDLRFDPVTLKELTEVEIEISVLTPLKPIDSIDEFELGKQGIYMVKGDRSGTFLPQVGESTNWSKEELLGRCARDKAGIGWEGWKDAELYTYEAFVFSEEELLQPKQ